MTTEFNAKQTAKQLRRIADLHDRGGWTPFLALVIRSTLYDDDGHVSPMRHKADELRQTGGLTDLEHDLEKALGLLRQMEICHDPRVKKDDRPPYPDRFVEQLRLLADSIGKKPTRPTSKLTVNDRMTARMLKDPECKVWSGQKWADTIGCAKSTIMGCPAWKQLAFLRDAAKAERAIRKSGR